LVLCEREELDVLAGAGVASDQAVGGGRAARVLVRVEYVQLLVAVAVNVARSHANGLAARILQRRRSNVVEAAARRVPLKGLVCRAEAGHDELELAVAVGVSDGDTVVELCWVGGEQIGHVLKEWLARQRIRRRVAGAIRLSGDRAC